MLVMSIQKAMSLGAVFILCLGTLVLPRVSSLNSSDSSASADVLNRTPSYSLLIYNLQNSTSKSAINSVNEEQNAANILQRDVSLNKANVTTDSVFTSPEIQYPSALYTSRNGLFQNTTTNGEKGTKSTPGVSSNSDHPSVRIHSAVTNTRTTNSFASSRILSLRYRPDMTETNSGASDGIPTTTATPNVNKTVSETEPPSVTSNVRTSRQSLSDKTRTSNSMTAGAALNVTKPDFGTIDTILTTTSSFSVSHGSTIDKPPITSNLTNISDPTQTQKTNVINTFDPSQDAAVTNPTFLKYTTKLLNSNGAVSRVIQKTTDKPTTVPESSRLITATSSSEAPSPFSKRIIPGKTSANSTTPTTTPVALTGTSSITTGSENWPTFPGSKETPFSTSSRITSIHVNPVSHGSTIDKPPITSNLTNISDPTQTQKTNVIHTFDPSHDAAVTSATFFKYSTKLFNSNGAVSRVIQKTTDKPTTVRSSTENPSEIPSPSSSRSIPGKTSTNSSTTTPVTSTGTLSPTSDSSVSAVTSSDTKITIDSQNSTTIPGSMETPLSTSTRITSDETTTSDSIDISTTDIPSSTDDTTQDSTTEDTTATNTTEVSEDTDTTFETTTTANETTPETAPSTTSNTTDTSPVTTPNITDDTTVTTPETTPSNMTDTTPNTTDSTSTPITTSILTDAPTTTDAPTSTDFTTEPPDHDAPVVIVAAVLAVLLLGGVLATGAVMYRRGALPCNPTNPNASVRPKPISLAKFENHCNQLLETPARLGSEFQLLQTLSTDVADQHTTAAALLPDNKKKNRYTNILPFDSTRVKLDIINDDPSTDYINASFVKGYSSVIEYIACQGPKEETLGDFWRMVYQHDVYVMVMVTNFEEDGKIKCEPYLPKLREQVISGDMVIRCAAELVFPMHTQRSLILHKGGAKRNVLHLHFREWPDFGCPDSPDAMLQFVFSLREHISDTPGCVLVHCSAGVGRTGTLIAVDILLQHIKASKKVDIFGTVFKLRKQRTNMVQTMGQYAYIYKCIRDAILDSSFMKSDSSPTNSLHPIYENVSTIKSNMFLLENMNGSQVRETPDSSEVVECEL